MDQRSQDFRKRARLNFHRSFLTFPMVCALFLAGCIIPGSIEERVIVNHALKVHIEFLDPSPEAPVWIDRSEQDASLRALTFSFSKAAVEDPDGDTLHHYWYIDYNPLKPSIETVFTPEFQLDPCDSASGFTLKDEFGLTSIVSDRPLDLSQPDFRTFPEEATTATITWRVVLYGDCSQ
jgi:hypothetical protein